MCSLITSDIIYFQNYDGSVHGVDRLWGGGGGGGRLELSLYIA